MTHQWMEIKIKELEKRIKALEEQGHILDKIRAEIDERKKNSGGEPNRDIAFNVCLQIIDKYKAETEQVGNPDRVEGE